MCTVIVTIRAVLWYVTSLVGTLLVLVALFTNRWLHSGPSLLPPGAGDEAGNTGIFLECTPMGDTANMFEGECIPKVDEFQKLFTSLDDSQYPHAWRGGVICFVLGFGILLVTDLFALLTLCCRSCVCCSVFTVCGSLQSFAALLFTLGLIAFPAGWGSPAVRDVLCRDSNPYILGDCSIGFAFWLAVAGTVCTWVASSLAIWAYQSTKSVRCETRQDEGEKCICLP